MRFFYLLYIHSPAFCLLILTTPFEYRFLILCLLHCHIHAGHFRLLPHLLMLVFLRLLEVSYETGRYPNIIVQTFLLSVQLLCNMHTWFLHLMQVPPYASSISQPQRRIRLHSSSFDIWLSQFSGKQGAPSPIE